MSFVRVICLICLGLSLGVGAYLIIWDVAHGFRPMTLHPQMMAVALMLVGASYALSHIMGPMQLGARMRAISLGGAFILWGAEQFLPMGPLVIAADCVLVVVFVVDLGLAVKKRLSGLKSSGKSPSSLTNVK